MAKTVTTSKLIQPETMFFRTGASRPGIRVIAVIPKAALQLKYPKGSPVLVGAYEASVRLHTTTWNVNHSINRVEVTPFVTGLTWSSSKETNYAEATLTLDNRGQLFNWVPPGTLFLIQRRSPRWRKNGSYSTYMSVYMMGTTRSNSGGVETITMHCYDRMKWLHATKPGKFTYKANKRHKRGWKARSIIKDICRRAKMPVGNLQLRNVYIKKIEVKGNAVEQINAVIAHVKKQTHQKKSVYHLSAHDGKLSIWKTVDKPKSTILFTDKHGIENAEVTNTTPEGFATQLKVMPSKKWRVAQWKKAKHKGKVPKDYKSKPIIVNPKDKNIQAVFGIITAEDTKISKAFHLNRAGMVKLARTELAKRMLGVQTTTFTTRGILGLWPETWVYLRSARLGVKGPFRVTTVVYTLAAGQLSMDLTIDLATTVPLNKRQATALLEREPLRY